MSSRCLNITQGCKKQHPTACYYYDGPSLTGIPNINTNDSLNTVISKLNNAISTSPYNIGVDRTYLGTNFANTTDMTDPTLKGKRFRIAMRGFDKLIYSTEWQYIGSGGFTILLPSFSVSPTDVFHLEFY